MGVLWISTIVSLLGGRMVFVLGNWGELGGDFLSWVLFWRKSGFSWLAFYFFWVGSIWLFSRIKEWNHWRVLEEVLGPFLGWLSFSYLGMFFSSSFSVFSNLGWFLVFLFLYILSLWIGKNYRSWVWYPSGKKGFLFLAVNILFFVSFFVFSLIKRGGLGSLDILSLGWVILLLTSLFSLGEYKIGGGSKKKK